MFHMLTPNNNAMAFHRTQEALNEQNFFISQLSVDSSKLSETLGGDENFKVALTFI